MITPISKMKKYFTVPWNTIVRLFIKITKIWNHFSNLYEVARILEIMDKIYIDQLFFSGRFQKMMILFGELLRLTLILVNFSIKSEMIHQTTNCFHYEFDFKKTGSWALKKDFSVTGPQKKLFILKWVIYIWLSYRADHCRIIVDLSGLFYKIMP